MKRRRKKKWVVLNPSGVLVTVANKREKAIERTLKRAKLTDYRDMQLEGYTVEEVRV